MSIRRRYDDALALDELGRFDGAPISALVAAAATARLVHALICRHDGGYQPAGLLITRPEADLSEGGN
jgi:ABC-type protease/lipase transport system fused ATPase/permease subunit